MKIITKILVVTFIVTACGQKETSHELFLKGQSFYDSENDSMAIITLSKAINLDTLNKDAYYLRAYANHRFLKYENAIFDYTKTIELDNKNDEAYYFRGVAKRSINDIEGAINDYSKAIEINPQNGEAFNNRGLLKIQSNLIKNGCEDLLSAKNLGIKEADTSILIFCK